MEYLDACREDDLICYSNIIKAFGLAFGKKIIPNFLDKYILLDIEFDESFDLSTFKPNCERHTDTSLEVKEDNSIEVANEISEPSQPSGQCFDTNPDFDQETLQLLNNGMQLAAVKRYSEVNAVSLIEAMEKVDSFVKDHKF